LKSVVSKCFGIKEEIAAISALLIRVDRLGFDRRKIDYIDKSRRVSLHQDLMAHLRAWDYAARARNSRSAGANAAP
jgi:hypothetical protein